jgi:hypothetical protein
VNSITCWMELSSSLGAIVGDDGSFELGVMEPWPPIRQALAVRLRIPGSEIGNWDYPCSRSQRNASYKGLCAFYISICHQSSNHAPL